MTGTEIRALLIKVDSDGELVDLDPTPERMRAMMGVERLAFFGLAADLNAFCDDEGRLNGSAKNCVATYLAWHLGYKGELYGPVLIFGYDDKGLAVDLPPNVYTHWHALTQVRYRLRGSDAMES